MVGRRAPVRPTPTRPTTRPPSPAGPTHSAWPKTRRRGENIGAPVTATDPDRDSLAYSLDGTDAASFYIDPATGQIQTSGPLNHEEKASHSVTVKADDARGGMATVSVTINGHRRPRRGPGEARHPDGGRVLEHQPRGELDDAGESRPANHRLRLPLQGADGVQLD